MPASSRRVQSQSCTVCFPKPRSRTMKKGIILWLLGVPVLGIIALALFGII